MLQEGITEKASEDQHQKHRSALRALKNPLTVMNVIKGSKQNLNSRFTTDIILAKDFCVTLVEKVLFPKVVLNVMKI